MHEIFIFIILIMLILFFLGILWFTKLNEGFADTGNGAMPTAGTPTDGSLPTDASNPNLSPDQYYGEISQSASISLMKSHELAMATANPDAIPNADGDAHGAGSGPYLNLTSFPDQPLPPDDIEAILNKQAEGFENPSAEDIAKQIAMNAAQAKLDSIKGQLTPEALKQRAIDEAKARAEAKAEELAKKQGKKALKGAVKSAKKLAGKLWGKLTAKLGPKVATGIMKKIMEKIAVKIAVKSSIAAGKGVMFMAIPDPSFVSMGFGIFMNIIAAIGLILGIALPLEYQDEGMCDAGWTRVSENWPSYLDNIPGVGDVFGALAPFMCSINACEPDEEEQAGLCYPKCDGGYSGVGPVCWTNNISVGVGVLKGCPAGDWQDQGLICAAKSGQICGDDCSKGWDSCRRRGALNECWGGCREGCSNVYLGELVGKFNNDSRLKCPGSHPEEVDGLCYKPCPMMGGEPTTITKVYPVYIRKLRTDNQDAAQKALANAIADKSTTADQISKLQQDVADALVKDSTLMPDMKAPYVRNPAGPRIGSEPVDANGDPVIPIPNRRWPATETPQFTDLLAGIENGKVIFFSSKMGGWMTFESIYGSYGKQLTKDGRKAVKVTMTSVGPQILTDVDGRCYRWNTDKGDWEWNNWGVFKNIAAANNSFTYFLGTDDKLYSWRWKGNPRGLGEGGGNAAGGWYGMIGIAANDFASGYSNKDRDHGNAFSTNGAGWEALINDWDKRYLWGDDKTYDNSKFGKPTSIAMAQNDTLTKFIATDKGYIYISSGVNIQSPNIQNTTDTIVPGAKQVIEGPVIGTAITSITVDTANIIYILCGGRFFKQVPAAGPEPQLNIPEIKFDMCATKFQPFGFCMGGMKPTGKMIPNNDYKVQHEEWLARTSAMASSIHGWQEIVGKTVTDIAIGPPVINEQYTAYTKYKTYMDIQTSSVYPKYPLPDFSVDESKIPKLTQTIVRDPRKKLRRIPLIPFQCMGDRGIAYGRGVGKPKLKTKMASKTPPPPPPPSAWLSSAHADDTPKYIADFSSTTLLQDMCSFYYTKNVLNSEIQKDGTIIYSYITKINSVIASSEQSADVICEITNTIVNPTTGALIATNILANSDRRFYFAIIKKTSKFVVTACTIVNGTGTYSKDPLIKSVNFTPTIARCINKPLTYDKCSNPATIDAMIKFYTDDPLSNIRTLSVTALELTGDTTCSLVWTSAVFDPDTNEDGLPETKAAEFVFQQNKTTDICAYVIKSYKSIDASTVKPLATPIVYRSASSKKSVSKPTTATIVEDEVEAEGEAEEKAEDETKDTENTEDTTENFSNYFRPPWMT
jgi:hypothetical protein